MNQLLYVNFNRYTESIFFLQTFFLKTDVEDLEYFLKYIYFSYILYFYSEVVFCLMRKERNNKSSSKLLLYIIENNLVQEYFFPVFISQNRERLP